MRAESMQALLEPRSVAIVGASQKPGRPGNILLTNLLRGGFDGEVLPVNPRGGEIEGLHAHPSLTAIGRPVDLVLIAVAREHVASVLQECVATRARSACIVTAGFGEADDWGRREQTRLGEILRGSDVLAIGPNTIGLVAMGGRLLASFVPFPEWDDGPVGIVAQSGVFAGAVASELMAQDSQRVGIHASVDIGNRIGVDEVAVLDAFAQHDKIGVIGFHLESFTDARRFLARAAEVKRHKPIVVLKPGRTRAGAQAAASHTGSLVQDDAVVDQLLAQHGIPRARDAAELFAMLRAFTYLPLPRGPRTAVVTYSGAMGVMATDELVDAGLQLAQLSSETVASIRQIAPAWQQVGNPCDLWSSAEIDPERTFREGLGAVTADPAVDQVLLILFALPSVDFATLPDALAEIRAHNPDKPVHAVLSGRLAATWRRRFDAVRLPIHSTTGAAARVMAATTSYAAMRDRSPAAHTAWPAAT